MFSYLAKNDCLCPLPEFEALVISFQIMNALHYLHENNVCHRDLKLDNILLEAPKPFSRVVLADFGIAKLINVSTVNASSKRMFTIVGTVEYSAPEIGFSHGPDGYDLKCDIWSMGIIIHIMLSGISPFFKDGQHRNIIESAKSGLLNFATREWHNISQHAQSFVQSLLYVDINKRSDINDCFDHSWIKSHQAELSLVYKKILNC